MPPFIGVKRRRSPSLSSSNFATPEKNVDQHSSKQTLFDAANDRPIGSLKENEQFINALNGSGSDTSLSDVSSSTFEDVEPHPPPKRRKVDHDNDEDEDEDEVDWEDAVHGKHKNGVQNASIEPSGDLELTLDKGPGKSNFINPQKKGPSKIERQIRIVTHCMHVQFLLFHNSMRSRFACDPESQRILLDRLSPTAKKEIETWRFASGQAQGDTRKRSPHSPKTSKPKRSKGRKSEDVRSQRDWGKPAERQEVGVANISRGDPVYRLLKFLAAYWKQRFTVTAPGLRKQGYKPLARLEEEIASFKNDKPDPEEHGERIANLEEFRECARKLEGSRDVGVQLFVALLRGLGLEARLVASLQPVGFGWNKNEEASLKKRRLKKSKLASSRRKDKTDSDMEVDPPDPTPNGKTKTQPRSAPKLKQERTGNTKNHTINGSKDLPIDLSDTSLSDLISVDSNDENESIVDITPSAPRKTPNMPYDLDLLTPTYWAEVISPITHQVYPVDPFILHPSVATKPEDLNIYEPRGARADKAKQVFAYVVAYSPDGTAKEVTTRYLKKHMWPGRTKGARLPIEKIPVYNKHGKIKHHEEYDWFKTVMSGYTRPHHMRTAVDDIEEATDLKPVKPEKREGAAAKEKEGTLQFYKTSAEYVLERHLRREEAIVPGAEPVRYFTAGKKGEERKEEEPVFLRKDVLVCRTGESWHKEGRQIKPNQTPMKMVPIRAVTLTRKREVEEAERDGGEKLKQGLYAWDQTEWIVPPPIVDGVIPKNAYGNMDCFVPTMVPAGAAHVPLRSTAKICKRLGIDFAEAVTGFEFGKQRAVPVVTGVVVAKEHEEMVLREWEKDEEERRIKEEGKKEKIALGMWKKFVVGLRIVERVKGEYGHEGGTAKEESNPFTNKKRQKQAEGSSGVAAPLERRAVMEQSDDDMAGGFIEDGAGEDGSGGGGFLLDDVDDDDTGGGFLPERFPEKEEAQLNDQICNSQPKDEEPTQQPNGVYLDPPSSSLPLPLNHRSPGLKPHHPRSASDSLPPPQPQATPPNPKPKRGRPPRNRAKTPQPTTQSTQPLSQTNKSGSTRTRTKKSMPMTSLLEPSSEKRRRSTRQSGIGKGKGKGSEGAVVRSRYFEGGSEDEDEYEEDEDEE